MLLLADSLSYGKWDVLLAASHKHENFQNKLRTGQDIKNDDWLPTFGVTYKPNNDIAIYASQTESLSRGAVVVNGSRIYDNAGDTLAPSTSKQREIGIKYNFENIFTTLAYFDIDTESLIDKELDNGLYHRVADGRDNYKGWEWTVNGQPADKWTVTGGLLYMNGKREKTNGGTADGKFINGAAKWSGVIGATYAPNEQWNIISRLNWVGEALLIIVNHRPELPESRHMQYWTWALITALLFLMFRLHLKLWFIMLLIETIGLDEVVQPLLAYLCRVHLCYLLR